MIHEVNRYQRHLVLDGFGPSKQVQLKKSHIAIVGAGGLGSAVSLYLNAAGIGKMTIIDDDRVDISNLQRQILYTEDDVQKKKVDCAKERLSQRNSQTVIVTVFDRLNRDNAPTYLNDADVIMDCTDNFDTRFVLSDYAKKAKKPLVIGACTGYIGQVITLDFRLTDSPCYNCLYPRAPDIADIPAEQLGVLSPLPGIVGGSQAAEAISILTHSTSSLTSTLWTIDLRNHKSNQSTLSVDPHCLCQHHQGC